jgi:hypothetical protein
MKRPAWRSLSRCLIAALAAGTGSARHAAILTRNYQKSLQAKEKLRWALKVT